MRVLVADDDASSRLIVRTMLRNLGHECELVADGDRAWEVVQSWTPDVVISDWKMPGLDGLELCQLVRSRDATGGSYTYFVLVTAQGSQQDIIEGMRSGADDYLIKPLESTNLEVRLIAASRVTALHAELGEKRRELVRLNDDLYGLARLDALTGLGNRLALAEHLSALEARVDRHGQRYCAAILDVDHFKAYNDTYGHLAGDEALRSVARALSGAARVEDRLFRYGGEEFLVLFPDETLEGATLATERLRAAVAALDLAHATEEPSGIVTVSAGLACAGPEGPRSGEVTLRAADAALYRAKQSGRNRLMVDGRS